MIRVLIVDDQRVVREGLRLFLSRDPEIALVDEAVDGAQAVEKARHLRPDVILMDLTMPVMDGISATAIVRRELPDTEVVMLTAALTPTSLLQAMQAGASGCLLKDTRPSGIRTAIQEAIEGRVHLSAQATELLVTQMQPLGSYDPLSEREGEVLQLLAAGCSNQEIMQRLHIAEATVKAHVRHILSKLGVQSRTQAVLVAMHLGLVAGPPGRPQ
jgi:NarL family two-component system response regulator LiaR